MNRLRNVVSRLNKRLTVQLAAALLAGSTFLSSLIGLYRDRLLNSMYLDTYKPGIDAYTVAFTIPDFMFFILVSGALSVTFVPVFTQQLAQNHKKNAWQMSSSMINFMAIITMIASVLIMIFAEQLVGLITAPEFGEARRSLTVSMMRVIAINPFLFAIATVIASIQQAVGRFFFFALAPMIYSLGIIIGALVFTNGITIFGVQVFEGGIMGVALGVVLGAVMQLVVSAIGLAGLGFDYEFKIYWKNNGFIKTLKLLPARSLDQGMDYIISLVELRLASTMPAGVIRSYSQATVLHNMPISLVGVAISTAAFPRMTEYLAAGKHALFKTEFQNVIRAIVWLALPIATITYFARGYIVSFIMNGGDPLIAGLLGALVVAMLFRTVYHIAARAFYAQQDTKTPLYISIVSIGLNIALAVWFVHSLNMGAYGLAYAQSIVAFIEVVILLGVMQYRIKGGLFDTVFVHALARMVSATGFLAVVVYFLVQTLQLQSDDLSFSSTFPKFAMITFVSAVVYVWICWLMRLKEANMVVSRVKKILFAGGEKI